MSKQAQKPMPIGHSRGTLLRFSNVLARELGLRVGSKPSVIARAFSGKPLKKYDAWFWLADEIARRGWKPPTQRQKAVARVESRTESKAFYESRGWRDVRFVALKKSDGCCCLCGRSKRDHGVVLHVDHIKPRSKFPKLALAVENLQVLCEDCNMGKSNKDDTDWRSKAEELDRQLDRLDWKAL